MVVQIKKQLAPQSAVTSRTSGYGNPCQYITIHQTGNTNVGANAQAHANIQSRLNPRMASWHYSVDDKEIIQSFDDSVKCWHATDGNGPGNTTSIGIEICINRDGDYVKAVQNGAKLTKYLMNKHGLSIDKVKQHRNWTPKDCPAQLRAGYKGITWNDFLRMVQDDDIKTVKPAPTKVGSVKITNPSTKAAGKVLQLPKTSTSWRVYPTNKAPTTGNEKGFLNPAKFGGLSYDIIGNPQKDVYTIKTGDFGTVNIYASPSTGAKVVAKKSEPAPVKPQATAPKPATAKPTKLYRVQIGAFSKKANADAEVAKAKRAGYSPYIAHEGALFKVQIGAYSVKANADKVVAELKRKGFNVFIA